MPGLPRPTISFTPYDPPPAKAKPFATDFRAADRTNRLFRSVRIRVDPWPALLLFLLLGLLCLLGTFGAFFGLLLALLDDFGLCRSRRACRYSVGSDHHFFLHRGDVRHRLILVGDELDLARVRQVGDAQHLAEC